MHRGGLNAGEDREIDAGDSIKLRPQIEAKRVSLGFAVRGRGRRQGLVGRIDTGVKFAQEGLNLLSAVIDQAAIMAVSLERLPERKKELRG